MAKNNRHDGYGRSQITALYKQYCDQLAARRAKDDGAPLAKNLNDVVGEIVEQHLNRDRPVLEHDFYKILRERSDVLVETVVTFAA